VEFFHIHRWRRFRLTFAENPSSPFKELIPPSLDDIRVDIELGGQFGQRLLALYSSKRHLGLEGRAMVPAGSSRHAISCSRHHAALRQKIHLSQVCRFPEPALLKQQLSKLVDALADGAPVHSVKDRMAELEGRKLKLMAELEQAEQPAPRLFPNMGQLYRERVAELIDELQADDSEGLRTRLRSLVDEVRLVPEGDDLRVEVRGALAGILHLATGGAGLDGASAGMASAGAVAQG
jgi:site-specific DNA recombinase